MAIELGKRGLQYLDVEQPAKTHAMKVRFLFEIGYNYFLLKNFLETISWLKKGNNLNNLNNDYISISNCS